MVIKVRGRSLSKVSNSLGQSLANSKYKAFRSIRTKHRGIQIMIFLAYSAGNVAASCFELKLQTVRDKPLHMIFRRCGSLAETEPDESSIVVSMQRWRRLSVLGGRRVHQLLETAANDHFRVSAWKSAPNRVTYICTRVGKPLSHNVSSAQLS